MDVTITGTPNTARGIATRILGSLDMAIQPGLGTKYASAVKVLA